MNFIDRKREIEGLHKLWNTKKANLFILYGRRRVGKTELLRQFCKDKPHLYFLAAQVRETDNLRELKAQLQMQVKDPLLRDMEFNSWDTALNYLAGLAKNNSFIVVLDEFQYLCEENKALPSLIQRFWDIRGKESRLFIVLCGSHVSFMEKKVLAEKSPLYGRRTGQLNLQPLPYFESVQFFKGYSRREKLLAYGIFGGIPAYLSRFNKSISLKDNILNEMLDVQGALYDEVNFLLRTELSSPGSYASILKAIAGGCTRLGEIAGRIGMDTTSANKYLHTLRELRLVKREVSFTEKSPEKSKKGRYYIADPFVKFWYRFVMPNMSLIQIGKGKMVYEKFIKPYLSTYMGEQFEQICREFCLWKGDHIFKTSIKRIGKEWSKNFDVDIIGEFVDGGYLLGECKWWKGVVGESVLNDLLKNIESLPEKYKNNSMLALFSCSGFTEGLKKRAKKEKVKLISAGEML
jgi:hypothetical protein